jgi:hypothetical protein
LELGLEEGGLNVPFKLQVRHTSTTTFWMDKITRGPDSTVEQEILPDEELVTVVEMSSVYMCHEDKPKSVPRERE